MGNLENLIQTCVSLGTASTLEVLGISSGEISCKKAKQTYKKWFADAYETGRIHPCRVDNKTTWFRVTDILTLKANDLARAELK